MNVVETPGKDIFSSHYRVELDRFEYDVFTMGVAQRLAHEKNKEHKFNPFDAEALVREHCCFELGWHHGHMEEDAQLIHHCLAVGKRNQFRSQAQFVAFYEQMVKMINSASIEVVKI